MSSVALVTGASRGIGRAIAVRLAEAGYRIRAHGRDQAALDDTCRIIRDAGGEAAPFAADLRSAEAIRGLAEWAAGQQAPRRRSRQWSGEAASGGGLDVVVHNAGIGGGGPVAKADLDRWDEVLDVDLRAPMRLTALTLPHVARRQGAFVFVGSISAKMGMPGSGAYCAAKHGLDGFAASLFEEAREQGVRVVRIHPGYVNTEMTAGPGLAAAKMIQPGDIAELVLSAVRLPQTACVVEMVVRPQRTPYLS